MKTHDNGRLRRSGRTASVDPQGFQFPGEFEITAMGSVGIGLEARVPALLVQEAGVQLVEESVVVRLSKKGHFVAVKVRFQARTRAEYERAHQVLRADPEICYTL